MKNFKFKKCLCVVLTLCILIPSFSITVSAYSKTLSMYFEKQQQTNWCWAATSQSIIDKVAQRRPTQNQIVTNIFGSPVNNRVTYSQDTQSLRAWGVGGDFVALSVFWGDITKDIDAGKPLKATIQWSNGAGHDLVIYGYYNNTSGTDHQIYYLDPSPSKQTVNLVSESYFNYNDSYFWTATNWKFYKTY